MRIIAGEYRGRRLMLPPSCGIRPTPDRVRGAVFNILYGRLAGCRVLDLFSGSGCIGLEALSRGASYVVFNDKDASAVRRIEEALHHFGTEDRRYALYTGEWQKALTRVAGQRFGLIYLDPPYREALYGPLLEALPPFLETGGVLAVEHPADMPLFPGTFLRQTDTRRYGTVSVSFFEKEESL